MNKLDEHTIAVQQVQEQMQVFYAKEQKVKIYHGTTNSIRAQKFESGKYVDVSKLNRIIEVNQTEKYVLVEPNVPMDTLIEATLEYGLIPPVVMEFPGITVGGGIQGGAGESSSYKYGLFHATCLEYELVLGNGERIIASPTQNPDLFFGTACSYGSIAIVTLVKLQLIPAKSHVHLTYETTRNFEDTVTLLQNKCSDETLDFVDGIIFSRERGVILSGRFSDEKELPIKTFRKSNDEWFYIHADDISRQHDVYEEIVPIRDYLFRYSRGAFWVGRHLFTYLRIPFTRLSRFILHKALNARTLYRGLHATNISQQYFVQDICLKEEAVIKFLQSIDQTLHIYPLWLCPLRTDRKSKFSPNYLDTKLVINVGVWGDIPRNYDNFIKQNKDVEKITIDLKGRKVLYAHAYYDRSDFWKIYDLEWYRALREKYFSHTVFPDIYDKTKVTEKYKPTIVLGILRALRSAKLPTE